VTAFPLSRSNEARYRLRGFLKSEDNGTRDRKEEKWNIKFKVENACSLENREAKPSHS
jgi:hypothetical protein